MKKYLMLTLMSFLTACGASDTQGLTDVVEFFGVGADAMEVHYFDCSPDQAVVGSTGDCVGFNADSTRLRTGNAPLLVVSSLSPSKIVIDLDGRWEAVDTGTVVITARGARNSIAVDSIEVR